jgi:hypothetical protein
MYSICKTTHPATGVEHAITCNFFNRAEKCLVVAGTNIIRVFRLIPDIDPTKKEKFTGNCDTFAFLFQILQPLVTYQGFFSTFHSSLLPTS